MNLEQLGWNPFFEAQCYPYTSTGCLPARVVGEHKKFYQVCGEFGECLAEISGKMRYQAGSRRDLPVVGDWVVTQPSVNGGTAILQAILSRKTLFSRKVAEEVTEEQAIAANVDTAFLVSGLDRDFNLRRLERYLTMVYNSGATPVIVLNKADLRDDLDACLADVEAIAFGVPTHPISAKRGQGLESLRAYVRPGQTVALLGSSGAGKSTIINALLGYERQRVTDISRHVNKGQHTTTHRELVCLPSGGMIIDNPGIRELQLWGEESDVAGTFEDIEDLAQECRFSDCRHEREPGCAVKAALRDGELDEGRFQSYLKQKKELAYLEQRQEYSARYLEKQKWQPIVQYQKALKKRK